MKNPPRFDKWRNAHRLAVTWSVLCFACVANAAVPPDVSKTDLFVAGREGYHAYRIPALIATPSGSLLAFCEGRRRSLSDSGDIDVLWRRSTDGGKTWSRQAVLWDDRQHCCGNPCAVADRETGAVWLLMSWSHGDDSEDRIIKQTSADMRRVYVACSTDDGQSWTSPKEITASVKPKEWTWYATGSGNGIQLVQGPWHGRLVVPCDHMEAQTCRYYSHVIYSDDHGKSWKLGGSSPTGGTNECAVAQLNDGRLMLNMRNYGRDQWARAVCFSADGGATWNGQRVAETLIEPICQASMIRCELSNNPDRSLLLFCNPASRTREKEIVKASRDDGRTWSVLCSLHRGPAAYSSLAALPGGSVFCLFENGLKQPYEKITLAHFTVQSHSDIVAPDHPPTADRR